MDLGDSIDRNLLRILEENARLSASELARRVGLARSTVQERISRLERAGIILGYKAIIKKADEQSVLAYLFIKLNQRQSKKIIADLQQFPEINSAHVASGDCNILCRVVVPLLEDLDALISDISDLDGVESISSSIVLSTKIDR